MKQKRVVTTLFFILIFSACPVLAQDIGRPQTENPGQDSRIMAEREIGRLAQLAGGETGVAAIHLETGRCLSVNGGKRFPMASTYKVPIAVHLLMLVDEGGVKLDAMVNIRPDELHTGSGIISKLLNKPGLSLSVANLFHLMMTVSDNTATDILLSLVGGPEAVNKRMAAIGIAGINISRSTLEMIADATGVAKRPPNMTSARYEELAAKVDPRVREKMRRKFNADPRDAAMPEAMAKLLQGIYRKAFLKSETADLLLETMRQSLTGEMRLKGSLPPGTPVAHKTGTMKEITNDIGMITLPENAGHVVIAVFIKGSPKEGADRERAIAEIARTVYDYFLLGSPVRI